MRYKMTVAQEAVCDRLRDEFGVPAEFAIIIASRQNDSGISNAARELGAYGVLLGGFVWSNTKEQHKFWECMYNALVSEAGGSDEDYI